MKVPLDTHALMWWASSGGARLSDAARELIEAGSTAVLVSAASLYEISIKVALGRLELPGSPDDYLPELLQRHGFGALASSQRMLSEPAPCRSSTTIPGTAS